MAEDRQNSGKKQKLSMLLLRITAVILLLVGLILVFNRQISGLVVKQNSQSALQGLTAEQVVKNQRQKATYDFSQVKEIDLAQAAKSRVRHTAGAVGAMAIPSVKLYLPVMLGLSDDSLSTGGATMRADQKMGKGNYPLAGHYMTEKGILFSPLEDVKLGAKVYLTDLKRVYVYQINYKKVVNPYAVWLVNQTKQPMVTLITCADGGRNRWALRGKLVKRERASDKKLEMFKLR